MKNVKETLLKLEQNNYKIIIFSNQSGTKLNEVLLKIQNIFLELLPIKINIFVASKNDYYRKPHTDML